MTDKFEKAKLYYSLAIREAILSLGDDFYDSEDAHSSMLEEHPEIKHLPSRLLKSESLFKLCLRDFIRAGWIDCIEDEFAPLFIRGNTSLDDGPIADINFRRLHDKYEKLGDSQFEWLDSALIAVVDSFEIEELNAILEKGESESATKASLSSSLNAEDYWSPIPLDREDTNQAAAVKALETLIEELRGDNGYGATHSEEKAFVFDGLSAVAKRLREESQISWMYLKEFAFKPLGLLIKRFGRAAIGTTAALARDSLFSWLKSKGVDSLDDLLR